MMRNFFYSILTILIFAVCGASSAQTPTLRISPSVPYVGSQAELHILSTEGVPEISSLPRADGVRWISNVSALSQSIQTVGGVSKKTFDRSIRFEPEKAGRLVIPSFRVYVDGKPVMTEPLTFSVSQAPEADSGNEQGLQPAFLTLRIEPDRKTVYIGEELSVAISCFVLAPYDLRFSEYPLLTNRDGTSFRYRDFRKENPNNPNFLPPQQSQVRIERTPFNVIEFFTKIRPVAAGALSLKAQSEASIVQDAGFFGARELERVRLSDEAAKIKVLPLPKLPTDAPPFCGLVGTWEGTVELSSGPHRVAEPMTLRVVFSGNGSTEPLIPLKFEPEEFRAYQPEIQKTSSGVELRYTLIPLAAGTKTLDFACSFFDASKGVYRTVSLKRELEIEEARTLVAAAESKTIDAAFRPDEETASSPVRKDILYLHRLSSDSVMIPLAWNAALPSVVLLAIGLLAFSAALWHSLRKRALSNDPAARRKLSARKRKGRILHELEAVRPADIPEKASELAACLNDLTGLPAGTPLSETAEKIKEKNCEFGSALSFLSECEWNPHLRQDLNEDFQKKLIRAFRKFLVVGALLSAAFFAAEPKKLSAADVSDSAASEKLSAADDALPADPSKGAASESSSSERLDEEAAMTHYDAGDFASAMRCYASRLKKDQLSADLFYNLGNCFYQAGDYPRALICYERARILAPRDEDALGNLNLTRAKLLLPETGRVDSPREALAFLRDALRIDEWLVLCAFAVAAALTAFAMRMLNWKQAGNWLLIASGLLLLVSLGFLGAKSFARNPESVAVVVSRGAELRSLPSEQSGRVESVLKPGQEVRLNETRLNWRRVELENGTTGWIRAKDAIPIWSKTPDDVAEGI